MKILKKIISPSLCPSFIRLEVNAQSGSLSSLVQAKNQSDKGIIKYNFLEFSEQIRWDYREPYRES